MRKLITLSALAALAVICVLDLPTLAAPAPSDKPRWEYAELQFTRRAPFAIKQRGGDGVQPADPDELASKVTTTVRWITGDGEIEATSWEDLGAKLKAPAPKKDASMEVKKLQLLNHLGGEGWELVNQVGGTPSPTGFSKSSTLLSANGTWVFKRRVQ